MAKVNTGSNSSVKSDTSKLKQSKNYKKSYKEQGR